MADTPRRLILANGEQYIDAASKSGGGRRKEAPRTYEEARDRLVSDVKVSLDLLKSIPAEKKFEGESVFCLRLHPDAIAKSYDPSPVIDQIPALRSIGSRSYRTGISEVAPTNRLKKLEESSTTEVSGRLVFVQGPDAAFERFVRQLERPLSSLPNNFKDAISRVERLNLLEPNEQITGFTPDWQEGRIELVIHPSKNSDRRQKQFLFELFEFAQIDRDRCTIRQYPNGPTFVSCFVRRSSLESLYGVNPLRSAHPLTFGGLKPLRSSPTARAPQPPASATRSTIKVGVFDGGIDVTCPLLVGHAEEDAGLSISTPPNPAYVEHGTAVAAAVLYGPLNSFGASDVLPPPPVSVTSFRALPTSDPLDVDLYESIDVIERVVPARQDIKVYNISFGPVGQIEDDCLSRFTYSLDQLAHSHKVAFYIAVGNDGEVSGENRIQAPSDLANGCGVAAHTLDKSRAKYSCIGPGRESAKIKPDFAAFGGCDQHPIHLASTTPGEKLLNWGTSFASPIAARLGALASESFERSSALLGRALLVHTASSADKVWNTQLGHGCIRDSIDDILFCEARAVTVVFQASILPKQIIKLPIPLPPSLELPGMVSFRWTIAALPPVDSLHPEDYTSLCLEDTFYPHSQRFNYTDPATKAKKCLHALDDKDEVALLLSAGRKKSSYPVSKSANDYRDEAARRAIECKWEPLVRRDIRMKGSGIFEPFLTLQAIGRNGASTRVDYVAIVTIESKKFSGDLYSLVREAYPALNPIRVRTEVETRVQIAS
jgi:hypothetical protein